VLRTHVERDLPVAWIHRAALERILVNLVMNARDVIRDAGTIDVRVRRGDDGVSIEVADDGPGIPPHVVSRLFEVGQTTKRDSLGIGLASARAAAEQMNTRLELVHTSPRGTCFRLRLRAANEKF